MLNLNMSTLCILVQRCTVNIEIRNLERSITQITPNNIMMEGNTVLTQYLITFWKLDYIDKGSRHSNEINGKTCFLFL